MSYDIYTEPPGELDWNYTYNIQPMTARAGLHSLTELDGMLCLEAYPIVQNVIRRMEAEPEGYRALNPSNGWGDYDGFLARLRDLAAGLARTPSAVVRVS